MEKAMTRERERMKEEQRKVRKQESAFRVMLHTLFPEMTSAMTFEEAQPQIENEEAFLAVDLEAERMRMFKEYQMALDEACSHRHKHHPKKRKNKKKDKRKSRSRSRSLVSTDIKSQFLYGSFCSLGRRF
jgi:pre-mRNA-processing factor 40